MKKKLWLALMLVLTVGLFASVGFGCSFTYHEDTYTVTFMNGTEVYSTQKALYGDAVVFPETPPEKEADDNFTYSFRGWNLTGHEADSLVTEYVVIDPVTFYAVFTAEDVETDDGRILVTFRDGLTGDLVSSQRVYPGEDAAAPEIPEHEHYFFFDYSSEFTNITARTEIILLFHKLSYPVYLHFLDKVQLNEVEYEEEIELPASVNQLEGISSPFTFDGNWFYDPAFTQPFEKGTEMSDVDVHLYARIGIRLTGASIGAGDLIYGGDDDFVYVTGLGHPEGLEYSYEWQGSLGGKQLPAGTEAQYQLRDAGAYELQVNVTATYEYTDSEGKQQSLSTSQMVYRDTAHTPKEPLITVDKATLTARFTIDPASVTMIYGDGLPALTAVYEGFQYDDGEDLIALSYIYKNTTLGKTFTEKLPRGSYEITAAIEELANYDFGPHDSNLFYGAGGQNGYLGCTILPKPLDVSFEVDDYTYGTGFSNHYHIDFAESGASGVLAGAGGSPFAYGETASVLGDPLFDVDGTRYHEETIPVGSHGVSLVGFDGNNQNYELHDAEDGHFLVAKRTMSVKIVATGCVYGGAPTYSFELVNVIEEDLEKFSVSAYSFTKSGVYFNATRRFTAGDYVVTAEKSAIKDSDNFKNYDLKEVVSAEFTVEKAPLTISASLTETELTYGTLPAPKRVFQGLIPEDTASDGSPVSGVMSATGSFVYSDGDRSLGSTTPRNVGSFTVSLTGYAAANYEITYGEPVSFKINPKALKLTVHLASYELTYGAKPAALSALSDMPQGATFRGGILYEGLIASDTVGSVFGSNVPSIAYFFGGERASEFHASETPYTADVNYDSSAAPNYAIETVTKTFTVKPRTLYIGLSLQSLRDGVYYYGDTVRPVFSYQKEGYDGFYGSEQSTYTAGAYLTLDGENSSGQFAAKTYTLGIVLPNAGEGTWFEKDYDVTYWYESELKTLEIAPKPITFDVTASDVVYGNRPAPAYGSPAFAYGETFESVFGAINYIYAREDNEPVEGYHVGKYTVTLKLEAANYAITVNGGKFQVTPKDLTVAAQVDGLKNGNSVYGDTLTPALSYEGFIGGEEAELTKDAKIVYRKGEADFTEQLTVGTYTVAVTGLEGLTDYAVSYTYNGASSLSFTVEKKALTVTVSIDGQFTYGDPIAPNEAAFEGFVYEDSFKSVFGGKIDYSYAREDEKPVEGYHVGDYRLTAALNEAENYEVTINYGSSSARYCAFQVAKKSLTVTVTVNEEAEETLAYGEAYTPAVTFEGFVDGEETKLTAGKTFTFNGNSSYAKLGVNTYTVTVTDLGDLSDYAVTYQNATLHIEKKQIAVTVTQVDLVYGNTPAPTHSAPELAYEETFESVFGAPSYIYARTDGEDFEGYHVGEYTVTLKLEAANYAVTVTSDDFTVSKAALHVALHVNGEASAALTYGDKYEFTASFEGFVNGESAPEAGKYTFLVDKSSSYEKLGYKDGSYELTVQGLEELLPDYALTYTNATFTVAKKALTVTAPNAQSGTYGNAFSWNGVDVPKGVYDDEISVSYTISSDHEDSISALKEIKQAGVYTIEYAVSATRDGKDVLANYALTSSGSFSIMIAKATVAAPSEIKSKTYNGENQTADVAGNLHYTVKQNNGGTNAGDYDVIFALTDARNYRWTDRSGDGESAEYKLTFTITKLILTVSETTTKTIGSGWSSSTLTLSDPKFKLDGTLKLKDPKLEGATTRSYSLNGTDLSGDFEWTEPYKVTLNGEDVTANITLSYAITITITNYKLDVTVGGNSFTYDGTSHSVTFTVKDGDDFVGFTVEIFKGGESVENSFTNVADGGNYTYTITPNDSAKYDKMEGLSFTLTIKKATLTVESFTIDSVTYDGTNHFAGVPKDNIKGLYNGDSATVTYSKKEGNDYSNTLEIVNVSDGGTVYYKVSAGDNYEEANGSYTVTIAKATVTVPEIASKAYNGENQTAVVSGDSLYQVTKNEGGTNVGEYDVTLTLEDPNNYRWADKEGTDESDNRTLTFEITKGTNAFTETQADNKELTYNGGPQTVEFNATSKFGTPQITSYTFNGASQNGKPTYLNAGIYVVTYTVPADGGNYDQISGTFTVTIAKAVLTVKEKSDANKVYDGNPHTGDEYVKFDGIQGTDKLTFNYTVEGGNTIQNAGSYTITVSTANPNYTFEGSTDSYKLTIAKATLTVTKPEDVNETYNGGNHFVAVTVSGLCGSDSATITYSTSESGEYSNTLAIKNAVNNEKIYYKVTASDNYSIADATGFYTVTITKKALTVTVTVNEKSKEDLIYGEAYTPAVTFEGFVGDEEKELTAGKAFTFNGNSSYEKLGVGEYTVTVTNLGDLSNYNVTSHDATLHITQKALIVTAPDAQNGTYGNSFSWNGVTVSEGVYGDAISVSYTINSDHEDSISALKDIKQAGSYTVTYAVSATRDGKDVLANYALTSSGSFSITIAKATVTAPTEIKSKTYNGENQTADVSGNLHYTVKQNNGGTNAGDYDVVLALTDARNYRWADRSGDDESAEYKLAFTIKKATLTVTKPEDVNEPYNGENHFAGVPEDNIKGLYSGDSATVTYSKSESGEYSNTLTIKNVADGGTVYYKVSAGDNYEEATGSYTVTITKAPLTVEEAGGVDKTYDGESHGPETYVNVTGQVGSDDLQLSYTVKDGKTIQNAGSYKITVSTANPNYTFEGSKNYYEFTIAKAVLNVSEKSGKKVYDGNPHTGDKYVEFDGIQGTDKLTFNYTVEDEKGGKTIQDVGEYKIIVSLKADNEANKNYEFVTNSCTIIIEKGQATIDTSALKFDGFTSTGDNAYSAEYRGTAYTVDWSEATANFGTVTVTNVELKNANTYTVTLSVAGTDNYDGAEITYTITITPKELTVKWKVDSKTYDGTTYQEKDLVTVEDVCEGDENVYSFNVTYPKTVSNETIHNAGTYTLTLKLNNTTNYVFAEDAELTNTFVIAKAQAVAPGNKPTRIEDVLRGFGKTLGEVELSGGYHWANEDEELGVQPSRTAKAYYNPDSDNYENSDTFDITITTIKTTITVNENAVYGVDWAETFDEAAFKTWFFGTACGGLSAFDIDLNLNSADTKIGSTYLSAFTLPKGMQDYYEFSTGEISVDIVFKIKSVDVSGTLYTIEDALAKATSGQTITVKYNTSFATQEVAQIAGYSVEGGNYTVRDGIRLILPYDKDKAEHKTDRNYDRYAFDTPNSYLKLELYVPADIVLYNSGNIVIGGITTGGNGGNSVGNGQTSSDYAQIKLGANAGIVSDGEIYAWGFITEESNGNGSFVNVTSGNLQIPFIVIEHRGGTEFSKLISMKGSPFNRFFMQNVTARLTVNYGATLIGYADLYAASSDNTTIIRLVGSKASDMISLKQGARVEAKYNTDTKVTDLTIFGSFKLNDLALSVASTELSTATVLFPISWYWNITLLPEEEGKLATVDATSQGIKLLPGAKFTIGKGVVLNAKDIAVYETFTDVLVSTNKLYEENPPAELTVNGTLKVQNIGGTVLNTEDGAVLNITSSTKVTSYEVTKSGTFTPTEYVLNIKHNIDGVTDSNPTEQGEKGVFEAKDEGWQSANTATDYQITYRFVFGAEERVEAIQNNNPVKYTINDNIDLQNASFEGWVFIGWYLDAACTDQPIYAIQGAMKQDLTIYGLFKQVNSYVFNYNTQQKGISIESDVVIADDLGSFDLSVHDTEIKIYDDELTQQQYFDGWWLDEQCTKPFNAENVLALGSGVNVGVQLYAKWSTKQTLEIDITNVNVVVNGNSYDKTTTLYVKPGTVVNISLTAVDNAVGEVMGADKGTIDSASISGVDWSGSHDTRSGTYSFVMPHGEVRVTLKGTAQFCIVEGTLITLADGTQKKVEDLLPTDQVLMFNHETGRYEACVLWSNVHAGNAAEWFTITYLKFSDGTELGIYYEHALFDKTLNRYVYFNAENPAEYIGHKFVKVENVNGEYVSGEVTLVGFENREEFVRVFSPVSLFHMNVVTNGLLSMTAWPTNSEGFENYFAFDEDMKYNEEAMQADIEKYGLYTYEDFKDLMTEDLFNALPWKYFKIAVGKGMMTWDDILYTIEWIYTTGQIDLG